MDQLLERASVRLEAGQALTGPESNFDLVLRGYETEDVDRVLNRLGLLSPARLQSTFQPPPDRKTFVRWCWEIAGGCFAATLILVCISWLLNTRQSQVLAVLGCIGFGVFALVLSLIDVGDDVPFGGVDFRGFLFSGSL